MTKEEKYKIYDKLDKSELIKLLIETEELLKTSNDSETYHQFSIETPDDFQLPSFISTKT